MPGPIPDKSTPFQQMQQHFASRAFLRLYAILIFALSVFATDAAAAIYYVSQSAGSDSNSGLSSAAPWQTLTKASTVTLSAGDSILLKAGDTWSEELQPKGSGTAGNPIYIGAYGAGNKPLIDRLDYTQDRNGIHLIDQAGYKIVGIEFYRCMSGIYAEYPVGSPNRNHLWIEDCYFHDSLHYQHYEDYPTRKIGLGISLFSHETANHVVLSDITVKNCTFRRLASGIWTNSPDNFNYFADNIWNFANLNILGCLFEEGYQWQLGLRGVSGGQVTNCVTHDIGRLNNFVSFNGVAGAMMYRLKDFTFTDSEWGFVSRGGGSFDGEAFDLEGNNSNMTFIRCLFHDTAGPGFMFFKGSNASPSNIGNLFTDCVWNGKAYDCPYSQYPKTEIFNASPGTAVATFADSRFYLSTNETRANNNTGLTFTNCLTRNLSDAGSGTNLALPATVAASSQQSAFEATRGQDGNTATAWRPSSSVNEWLELTFSSPTLVNEFRLREEAGSSISRYTIQYWDSATSTWMGCFNGRAMGANFIAPIVSRTTTKVRLLITSTTSGTPGIVEFEAYSVAIPPPPTTILWGVGDGLWDVNTTTNWKNTGGTPVKYQDGDLVVFDDTASGTSPISVTVNGTMTPTSTTVNSTKDYTFTGSGGITGSGTLTKSNSGTLTFSGTNTYTGGTTINGGTLRFGSATGLSATGGIVLGGGTLEYTGSGTAGTYNLSAAGGSSYLVSVTHATGTLTATRAGGNYNSLIKRGAGTLVLANNNQDSGGVRVDGGALVLSGTSSNPVNWSTTNTVSDVLPGATLKLGNTQVGLIFYDGGTFHMSGGTFDLNGQNPVADQSHSAPVIDGSGTITNSAAGTTGTALFKVGTARTFSGNIIDGAGGAKVAITLTSGSSNWTISGVNTHSGATTIASGTMQAGSTTALSQNSAYAISSAKTLALNGFNNSIGSLAGAGNVTLGTAMLTLGNNNTSTTFSGTISGAGGSVVKIGTGNWTISSTTNSYTGGLSVNEGTVTLSGASSRLGATTNPLTLGGGALNLGTTTQTTGPVSITGAAASGNSIHNGSLSGTSYAASNSSGNAIIAAHLLASGSAGLTKSGSGTLTLSGSNTYTGTTSISAGILSVGNVVVSGGTSHLGNATSAVALGGAGSEGTLSYTGGIATYTRGFTVTGGGGQLLNAGTGQLTVGTGGIVAGGLFTVGGSTQDIGINSIISGPGGLTKTGGDTVTLAAANTYGGTTTVSTGRLLLTNPTGSATGSGPIAVSTGATLAGTGSATGTVTVTGGTVNPGLSLGALGTLSLGGITFNGGTVLADIASNASY